MSISQEHAMQSNIKQNQPTQTVHEGQIQNYGTNCSSTNLYHQPNPFHYQSMIPPYPQMYPPWTMHWPPNNMTSQYQNHQNMHYQSM